MEHETENATMNANVTIERSNEKWNKPKPPTSQVEANANLIAAAPDLLEILQLMAEKDFEFSEYECRLARMAIAKATGG